MGGTTNDIILDRFAYAASVTLLELNTTTRTLTCWTPDGATQGGNTGDGEVTITW